MPIADIEIVCASRDAFERHDAQALADALGRVLGVADGTAWVRLRWLPSRQYAENGAPRAGPFGPVFVSLLLAALPDEAEVARHAAALTTELARLMGINHEHVHVQLQPLAAARQAFGGRLLGRR